MAGIYIHIPFCKRLCSYCDFYKSTLLNYIPDYLKALGMELEIRHPYLQDEVVETVYIGGGTPSLLSPKALSEIFLIIRKFYRLSDDCEITMEANPDDLSREFLGQLHANTPVNRLSIGIQSFIDRDLRLLNRRHTAAQAIASLEDAQTEGYKNISMDLIYGLPGLKDDEWLKNLETAFSLNIQHLSAYHLTIEPGTALSKQISQGKLEPIQEENSVNQFTILHTLAARNSYIHYEISNLAREGFFSRHNGNYWQEKKYLGAGPSAHSFDLVSRQWNLSGIKKYIEAVTNHGVFFEREELSPLSRYNEYLMVSLRTMQGVDAEKISHDFGEEWHRQFCTEIQTQIDHGNVFRDGSIYKMTEKGWMISDYILAGLMKE